jgi:hypothetical protein
VPLHVTSQHITSQGGHGRAAGTGEGLAREDRVGVMERIRRLSRAQQDALRAIDREEQAAIEIENLEADHVAAEEAYLRRKDRLLGHEVPDVYVEVESARALLAQAIRKRQERFEAMRIAVLSGRSDDPEPPAQLALLPGQ